LRFTPEAKTPVSAGLVGVGVPPGLQAGRRVRARAPARANGRDLQELRMGDLRGKGLHTQELRSAWVRKPLDCVSHLIAQGLAWLWIQGKALRRLN
jgi:hypothetical protein